MIAALSALASLAVIVALLTLGRKAPPGCCQASAYFDPHEYVEGTCRRCHAPEPEPTPPKARKP